MACQSRDPHQRRQKAQQALRGTLYSVLPSFVLGFHGCDQSVATRAVHNRQHLRFSTNEYDWLGSGVYFWKNSPERAMSWAKQLQQRKKIKKPAVIGAVIDLGLCLNLLDRQHLLVVREAYQNLLEACKNSGVPLPKNRAPRGSRETLLRDLDCATINMVHQIREVSNATPYDTVRAAFIEGQPLYESRGFRELNHIQICVRNLRCIKGYFFPLDDASTR